MTLPYPTGGEEAEAAVLDVRMNVQRYPHTDAGHVQTHRERQREETEETRGRSRELSASLRRRRILRTRWWTRRGEGSRVQRLSSLLHSWKAGNDESKERERLSTQRGEEGRKCGSE